MSDYRTTVNEKNGRVRIEREFRIGSDRWMTITRLSFASTEEAVEKWPLPWRGNVQLPAWERPSATSGD